VKLYIGHKGQVFEVTDKLEDYDLTKPAARDMLIHEILMEKLRIEEYE
jgi:hypothetical protein